jgi:uncharacterized membrane protein YcaP (DUF421 family)
MNGLGYSKKNINELEGYSLNWVLVWQTVGVIVFGTVLFRFAGRKSISQMTITQVVIMIGIGSLLVQPLTGNGYWVTLVVAAILIACMIIIEYLEFKINPIETLATGRAIVVIERGQLIEKGMDKLRLTTDRLEMRLRQAGIANISDVEWATLEVSGNLGYTLKSPKQPATKEDIAAILSLLEKMRPDVITNANLAMAFSSSDPSLFTEIKNGHTKKIPPKLQ